MFSLRPLETFVHLSSFGMHSPNLYVPLRLGFSQWAHHSVFIKEESYELLLLLSFAMSAPVNGNTVPSALVTKLLKGGIQPAQLWRNGEKPNIALWLSPDRQLYKEEIPYPVCGPDEWYVFPIIDFDRWIANRL
jgi:hypothetical protein